MKTVLMNGQYPWFVEAMEQRGFRVIQTDAVQALPKPEQYHADMQLLKINDQIFTLQDCRRAVGGKYPENVLLNCLYLGNRLYGKLSSIDDTVTAYCRENDIALVHVNQGYTRCSTLVVCDQAVITADSSIENALRQNGAEVLRIRSGHIQLDGYSCGFIGGASATVGDTVFFFGNAAAHPDFPHIQAFIRNYNSNLEILCEERPLTDIGGAVVIS